MKKKTKITSTAVNRVKSITAKKNGGKVPKQSFAARLESAMKRKKNN